MAIDPRAGIHANPCRASNVSSIVAAIALFALRGWPAPVEEAR